MGTDYATKWVKARALQGNTAREKSQLLYEVIITRFGCLLHLISDEGGHFINNDIHALTEHFLLQHTTSTTYYLQGNGQVESRNKVIVRIL